MNFHRSWGWWLQLLIVIVGPAALLCYLTLTIGLPGYPVARFIRGWIPWSSCMFFYLLVAWKTLTPLRFRFIIDASGLRMRTQRVVASLTWEEIDSIILDDIRLLVVPAAGYRPGLHSGLTRLGSTTPDGLRCQEVLGLSEVWEPWVRVAAALSTYAGPRFVDLTSNSTNGSG